MSTFTVHLQNKVLLFKETTCDKPNHQERRLVDERDSDDLLGRIESNRVKKLVEGKVPDPLTVL